MAIPFPTSPYVGELFTYDGVTYVWNGADWMPYPPTPRKIPENRNYSFNEILIDNSKQFNSFRTRTINFEGINLNIYSLTSNTLVFSAQSVNSSVISVNSITSVTESNNTITVNNSNNTSSSFTIDAVTSGSYSNGTITLSGTGNVNGTQITGLPTSSSSFTGGTITGPTNFTNGLSANTISATTYYNYPDTYVTGFSLTNDVITLSQNRTDSYSSFTVTLSGLTGTSQQIAYYNASGNLTGDTNFTRLDETNSYTTTIDTVNFSNINEHQDTVYDFSRVRNRVFNDDISLFGVTDLGSQLFLSKIENTSGGTISSLEILETSGNFRYQDSGGTYSGFFYNSNNPGWSVVRSGTQYDYNLPKSPYLAGSVLTDVSGDGNLQWVVPTSSSSFTGGTVSGATIFTNGLTANTISATTYQNLPATPFLPLTGGTVSGNVRIQPTPSVNDKPLFSISENSSESIAIYGLAGKGTNAYGVYCDVSPSAEFYTITNGIGGYFNVGGQFSEGEPTNKYSLQLIDGTEGVGKVLTSVTSDGKANWVTPRSGGSDLYLFYNY
jgi:hypothetical protein